MRVLLALDGSRSAELARQAVDALRLRDGSIVDVVAVVEPLVDVLPAYPVGVVDVGRSDERAAQELRLVLDEAAAKLERPGLIVRRTVLVGRPASTIVDLATEVRAELILMGSRGRGPLKSMVLGSVSAEVVDHAPCPVLVVRGSIDSPFMFAADGSATAAAAITFLVGNRLLVDHRVEVLSVLPRSAQHGIDPIAGMSDAVLAAREREHAEVRKQAETRAAEAALRLAEGSFQVRWSISEGDPAHEIIEAANELGCGLVVVGTRGITGVKRLVLGSVARNVLLHTHASVLIVREPLRVDVPEARERTNGSQRRSLTTAAPA